MTLKVVKEYDGEWKISVDNNTFENIITPSFSPLAECIAFCFEAFYQLVSFKTTNFYLFKLKVLKLHSVCVSPKLEVSVSVKVCYHDGTLYHEYSKLSPTCVDSMKVITFPDVFRNMINILGDYTTHHSKMSSSNSLIIKCKMTFYENQTTQEDKLDTDKKLLNKCMYLTDSFKDLYESSVLSDFVFKVGEKTFPAHKAILATHSPVFKNMMTHEFLESKNNSVTITDTTPEIFDTFLKCLYSSELEDKSWDYLKEIYYLADKYDVGFLKNECTNSIILLLSENSICDILQLSYKYSDPDLKSAAIAFAAKFIKTIVSREDWKELVKTNPMIGYEVISNFIPK